MLPKGMENYLSEISRVLKPNGKWLISFFLVNEEALTNIQEGNSTSDFNYVKGECRIDTNSIPGSSVSYDESFIRRTLIKNMLSIPIPVLYSSWCGRKTFLSYQDNILACEMGLSS